MQGGDSRSGRRLDGWKAIAGYFNRDRSTVMRWARDRDLPVRRLPGGKQGSVFALEQELAAWALRFGDTAQGEAADAAMAEPAPAPPVSPAAAAARPGRRWRVAAALVGTLAITSAAMVALRDPAALSRTGTTSAPLPDDPTAAAEFVAARDLWARRTNRDLTESIRLLNRVIARVPDFAPAYAALADAWLLKREYGEVSAQGSFDAAEHAAERAIALDPNLAAAHRALGFIAYWGANRKEDGIAGFRRALALDDHDGQTHFWFANVLADTGQDAAAQAEYARARLLLPGSSAIEIEHAYSHWLAGRDRRALAELTALARRDPQNPNIHLCLSWVYISTGDLGAFVRANALVAKYRGEPQQIEEATALERAYAKDPAEALALLVGQRRAAADLERGTTRQAPALFAASMGDRATTLSLMDEGIARGEHWYGHSVHDRIAARWPGDPQVAARLARLYADQI